MKWSEPSGDESIHKDSNYVRNKGVGISLRFHCMRFIPSDIIRIIKKT